MPFVHRGRAVDDHFGAVVVPRLLPSITAGPLIAGSSEFTWITQSLCGLPVGLIWMRLPPPLALFSRIAHRKVCLEPSSSVLLTTSVPAFAATPM